MEKSGKSLLRSIWKFLQSPFGGRTTPQQFYLSGGTALAAFYLKHRYSDDLDFFTRDPESLRLADRYVKRAARVAGLKIDRVEPKDHLIQYFFSGDAHPSHPLVKSEFISDPPPYPAEPRLFGGILVDDLLCIAVNKVTIHTRFEPKDYFDLYFIVQSGEYRREDLIRLAKEKMPGLDELTIAARFQRIQELPNLADFQRDYMLIRVEPGEIIRFYQEWATQLFALFPPPRQE